MSKMTCWMLVLVGTSMTVASAGTCLPAVQAGVERAHPGSRILACAEEREEGGTQWDVVLETRAGQRIELDLSPDGTILQTEEGVELSAVPQTVLDAFRARFPRAKAKAAAKETAASGTVVYEIVFGGHEAKFAADGTFVEDEADDRD